MGTIKLDTITPLSTTTDVTFVSNKFVGSASGNITITGEGGSNKLIYNRGYLNNGVEFSWYTVDR